MQTQKVSLSFYLLPIFALRLKLLIIVLFSYSIGVEYQFYQINWDPVYTEVPDFKESHFNLICN